MSEISKEKQHLQDNKKEKADVYTYLLEYLDGFQDMSAVIKDAFMGGDKVRKTEMKRFLSNTILGGFKSNLVVKSYDFKGKMNSRAYLYNGTYWDSIHDNQMMNDFVRMACEKMGVPEMFRCCPKFMGALHEDINYNASHHMEQHVPKGEVWMNMQNGKLVIRNNGTIELMDHCREDYFTYCLPYTYDPEADCPMFHKYMDEVLPDKDTQKTVMMFAAYCFTRDLKLEKMLVLMGLGSNGKSVFMDVISALFGEHAVSYISLSDLTADDEKRSHIEGKYVNISSETGRKLYPDVLKKLASGEEIDVRTLYRGTHIMRHYAKLIVSFNKLPKAEQTYGWFRRWLLVVFKNTIDSNRQDPDLCKKLCTELSGIMNWILELLQELLVSRKLYISEECEKNLDEYKLTSDSVAMFLAEWCERDYSYGTGGKALFRDYKAYCNENVRTPLGKQNFYERMVQLGVKRTVKSNVPTFNIRVKAENDRA